MTHELPAPLAKALADLRNSHRYRLLSNPERQSSGEWTFRVLVGPEWEPLAPAIPELYEFQILCPAAFPFDKVHAIPCKPELRWFPHQNGDWPKAGSSANIICPPALHSVGTAPTLRPYLDHYYRWVADALAGRLSPAHENFELPHVVAGLGTSFVVYADGGTAVIDWTTRHACGIGTVTPLKFLGLASPAVLGVSRLFPVGNSSDSYDTNFNTCHIERDAQTKWIPWAFVGSPVAQKPHRPHLHWKDFAPHVTGRIESALSYYYGFKDRAPFMLLGFAIPRTWQNRELIGMHWQAVDIAKLPIHRPSSSGFRKNPPPGKSAVFAALQRTEPALKRIITRDIGRESLSIRMNSPASPIATNPVQISKVAFLGVGALGGSIARSLVPALATKALLVDNQKLEPGNLIRHELPALCLEQNKAKGLSLMLNGIRAECSVNWLEKNVITDWDALLPELQTADLIVDVTTDFGVRNKLAESEELRGALLAWAYLKPGPEWGVLALRARNALTGLQDAETALKYSCQEAWAKLEAQAENPPGLVWPEPGCHHPTFAAPFHRVRMLADAMTATLLAWLHHEAATSIATLYSQHEPQTHLGVETRIVGQIAF